MARETIKVVKIDTDPAVKSLKDLRNELKQYKDQMANLEEGSDAFLEVANSAGELKHQIDEINESIKGASSDFGDMIGNVTNVAAGLVGAFSAVQGGLQALGVENEAIEESLKQMQGLMAVVQGLSSIDTAIKSMDKLRKSITATSTAAKILKTALQPKVFLAITAAVSGLVAVFRHFKNESEKVAEIERKRTEQLKQENLERRIAHQEELNKLLREESDLMKIYTQTFYGANRIDASKSLIAQYREEIEELKKLDPSSLNGELLELSIQMNEFLGKGPFGDFDYSSEHKSAEQIEHEKRMKELQEMLNPDPRKEDPAYKEMERQLYVLNTKQTALRNKWEDVQQEIAHYQELLEAEEKVLKQLETEEQARKDAEKAKKGQVTDESLDIELEKLKRKNLEEQELLEKTIEIEQKRLKLREKGTIAHERQLTTIFNLENKLEEVKTKSDETEEKKDDPYDIRIEKLKQLGLSEAEFLSKSIEIEKERLLSIEAGTLAYEQQKTAIFNLETQLKALGEVENDYRKQYLRDVADEYLKYEATAKETYDRVSLELKEALEKNVITQQEYNNASKALEVARSRYIADNITRSFAATSDLVTALLDGLADQQDQTNKEGFEKSKKLQIASATIQMLTGIATALAGAFTTKTGPWDIALAAIQAATIATTGAFNISKIKNTKYDGAGSAANLNSSAINNTIIPPVQYSSAVQGASTEGAIKDSKVYVTETDIVSTMNKVSVQETENTY